VTKGNGAVLCRILFFLKNDLFSSRLRNVTTFTEYWAAGLRAGVEFSPTQLVVAGPRGPGARENTFVYSPGVGVVWDQVTGLPEGHIVTSYPLKPRCCVVSMCLVCIDCVERGVSSSAMLSVGLCLVVYHFLRVSGLFFFLPRRWTLSGCALCSCGALLSGFSLHVGV